LRERRGGIERSGCAGIVLGGPCRVRGFRGGARFLVRVAVVEQRLREQNCAFAARGSSAP
jgi:hypothetical protein